MANVIRPISENGVVLSTEFKKAIESFKDKDGNVIPAQPNRWVAKVASSYTCDKKTGLEKPTILDYKIDEETFNKLKFLDEVKVIYEMSTSGTNKPVSLTIISK